MGYAWGGVCYQDSDSALNAFSRAVPAVDSSGINSFIAAPTVNGSGLISWSIANRSLTTGYATTQTGTTQLMTCSNPDYGQWPEQGMIFYLALFFACFMGFRTGFTP